MATTKYESVRDEIYERIRETLERKDEACRFAPSGCAENILSADILRILFTSLDSPGTNAQPHYDITPDEFVRRVQTRKLHRFLAIMIFASCSSEASRLFVSKLVASDTWPVISANERRLDSLPAELSDLNYLFDGHTATVDKFRTQQACFCPISIGKQVEMTAQNAENIRFPFLEEPVEIGSGSYGKVYKVIIAQGYFCNPESEQPTNEAQPVAKKDYITTRRLRERPQKERDVLQQILHSPTGRCDYILENYGSLEIGNTYSLFMPLAICDLRKYMMENHKAAPGGNRAKARMILCAGGLASGLKYLHTEIQSPDQMDNLVCYHMDLKPSNILIFWDTRPRVPEGSYIWKLSDFGMSRVKVVPRNKAGGNEQKSKTFSFASWFDQHKPSDPSTSPTAATHESTYAPPESCVGVASMAEEGDVWALGCIISILFAYLEEGSDGVVSYRERRLKLAKNQHDKFFLDKFLTGFKVHPAISSNHVRLVDKARARSPREGRIVKDFLRFLDDSVLQIDQGKRKPAGDIANKLVDTYRDYMDLELSPSPKQETSSPSSWFDCLTRWLRSSNQLDQNATVWSISTLEDCKGCEVSSNAICAFWTDTELFLFTPNYLRSDESEARLGPSFDKLTGGHRFWKSVYITDRYLIASLTGGGFHFYIFDLKGGSQVGHNFDKRYVVSIPELQEIEKLTISPDSKVVVCVLRHQQGEDNGYFLFHAKISDMIEATKRPDLFTTRRPWSLQSLGRSVGIVKNLEFSTRDSLYVVLKPDPMLQGGQNITSIISITSLASGSIFALDIEAQGQDGGNAVVPFFTTFAPLHGQPTTCAVVTRGKTLRLLDPSKEEPSLDRPKNLGEYRILNLMTDPSDDKIYAIGRTQAHDHLLALEIILPRHGSDLSVKRITKIRGLYKGADFVSRLAIHENEKYIYIAVLAGQSQTQSAIYRVHIESPSS